MLDNHTTTTQDEHMKTHYTYLRDPENPNRVITVARVIDEAGAVRFGLAVCKPDHQVIYSGLGCWWYETKKGDQHKKKIGRDIAEGRMNHAKSVEEENYAGIVSPENSKNLRPMEAIAHAVCETGTYPEFVHRTFYSYLFDTLGGTFTRKRFGTKLDLHA